MNYYLNILTHVFSNFIFKILNPKDAVYDSGAYNKQLHKIRILILFTSFLIYNFKINQIER